MAGQYLVAFLAQVDIVADIVGSHRILAISGGHQIKQIHTGHIIQACHQRLGANDGIFDLCVGVCAVGIYGGAGIDEDVVNLCFGEICMELFQQSLQIGCKLLAIVAPDIDIIVANVEDNAFGRKRLHQPVIGQQPIPDRRSANAHIVAGFVLHKAGLAFPAAPEVHIGVTEDQGTALIGAAMLGNVFIVQAIHAILETADIIGILLRI